MKKTTIIAGIAGALLFCAAGGIFSQQAVIQEIAGTVELKHPGSDVWESARQGQSITADTVISTGFGSSALIDLGSSQLTVRPLTRLSITELVQRQGSENVELNLRAGRVRVEVNPPVGMKTDFTVRTPTATAAVRGTVFEFDALNLRVTEGTVEFSGDSGTPLLIDAGGLGYVPEQGGRATRSPSTAVSQLRPDLPIAAEAVRPVFQDAGQPSSQGDSPQLSVTIGF